MFPEDLARRFAFIIFQLGIGAPREQRTAGLLPSFAGGAMQGSIPRRVLRVDFGSGGEQAVHHAQVSGLLGGGMQRGGFHLVERLRIRPRRQQTLDGRLASRGCGKMQGCSAVVVLHARVAARFHEETQHGGIAAHGGNVEGGAAEGARHVRAGAGRQQQAR